MATIFSHVHFCPACNEMWTCVCWMCEEEQDDQLCKCCQERIQARQVIENMAERVGFGLRIRAGTEILQLQHVVHFRLNFPMR